MYSAIAADVPVLDDPSTLKNVQLVEELLQAKKVYILFQFIYILFILFYEIFNCFYDLHYKFLSNFFHFVYK